MHRVPMLILLGLLPSASVAADSAPVTETIVTVDATTRGCAREPVRLAARKLLPAFEKCIRRASGKAAFTFSGSAAGTPARATGSGSFKPDVHKCLETTVMQASWPGGDACEMSVKVHAVRRTRWIGIDHDE